MLSLFLNFHPISFFNLFPAMELAEGAPAALKTLADQVLSIALLIYILFHLKKAIEKMHSHYTERERDLRAMYEKNISDLTESQKQINATYLKQIEAQTSELLKLLKAKNDCNFTK